MDASTFRLYCIGTDHKPKATFVEMVGTNLEYEAMDDDALKIANNDHRDWSKGARELCPGRVRTVGTQAAFDVEVAQAQNDDDDGDAVTIEIAPPRHRFTGFVGDNGVKLTTSKTAPAYAQLLKRRWAIVQPPGVPRYHEMRRFDGEAQLDDKGMPILYPTHGTTFTENVQGRQERGLSASGYNATPTKARSSATNSTTKSTMTRTLSTAARPTSATTSATCAIASTRRTRLVTLLCLIRIEQK